MLHASFYHGHLEEVVTIFKTAVIGYILLGCVKNTAAVAKKGCCDTIFLIRMACLDFCHPLCSLSSWLGVSRGAATTKPTSTWNEICGRRLFLVGLWRVTSANLIKKKPCLIGGGVVRLER